MENPISSTEACRSVLVVEDNDAVRDIIVDQLAGDGYHVLSASGRSDAAALARSASEVSVVLTDLSLCEGRGEDVALDVLEIHPHASVLFVSGKRAIVMNPEDRPRRSQFLAKPFRMGVLSDVVRALAEPVFV